MLVSLWILRAVAGQPLIGTWTAGDRLDTMREEIRARVETCVAGVGPLRRALVRWALLSATAPCARIGIEDEEGKLAIRCDDQKIAVAPDDGREVTFTGDDGRAMQLVHRVEDNGTVFQSFEGKHGTRINRFARRPEGGLTVEVTIQSPQLEEPLRYSLRYDG